MLRRCLKGVIALVVVSASGAAMAGPGQERQSDKPDQVINVEEGEITAGRVTPGVTAVTTTAPPETECLVEPRADFDEQILGTAEEL
jgi:hypothetical protein